MLDFVATVAERGTTDVEMLPTQRALAHWIADSGLVDNRIEVTPDDLERAKTVREAMFRLIASLLDSTAPADADRRLVNRTATGPRPVAQLTTTGTVRRTGTLGAVLAVLATDCIELFEGPDRDLLSRCADPKCTRVFLDRSRGRRRRWCDMKGCGDRAKASAYRQRHSRQTPAPAR